MRATFDTHSANPNRPSTHFVAGLFAGVICSATLFSLIFFSILFAGILPSHATTISHPLTTTSLWTQDDAVGGQITNTPRPIGDIRRDVKAYVKNSKQDKDLNLQVGAVVDLCMIHREMVLDARFSTHQQMQNLRAQVATRLKNYRDDLKVTMKRRQRNADKELKARAKQEPDATERFVLEHEPDSDSEDVAPIVELSEEDQFIRDSMSNSMYSMGQVTGGPTQVFGYLSGNFAPPWDYSDELIDLIETTINPDFWRTNGGDGVIRYYDPSQILVVSASAEVHDRLSDMLEMMRFLKW